VEHADGQADDAWELTGAIAAACRSRSLQRAGRYRCTVLGRDRCTVLDAIAAACWGAIAAKCSALSLQGARRLRVTSAARR